MGSVIILFSPQFLPIYIVLFGTYSLISILYKVFTLRNNPSEYEELKRDIDEARMYYKQHPEIALADASS
ncbi:hypothetical protein GEMRC1_005618 [Eukaryota sp. GEM-RC1]